jgi:hypothetical protein
MINQLAALSATVQQTLSKDRRWLAKKYASQGVK